MSVLPRCFFCLFVAAALPRADAAERTVKESFAVQPGCTLKIDTHRGSITVTETDVARIEISVSLLIGADEGPEAERLLAGLQLETKAEGNTVSILARNPRETRARWIWNEDKQIELIYRISVPRDCNVDLKATNGSVTIGNLRGRMTAQLQQGEVFFRHIEGTVDASVGTGDVIVSRCTGATTVRVRQGWIRVGTIGGLADLKNLSGGVELQMARGGVIAQAVAGDIVVGFPRQIGGDAQLSASGGNVVAQIDPAAGCRIEASSFWGRVQVRLPVAVESGGSGKRSLAARLNGGGPLLAMHASGGHVRIERGATLFE